MERIRAPARVALLALCLAPACFFGEGNSGPLGVVDGGGWPEPTPDAEADASVEEQSAERLVHWQVNIEWTVEDMGEDAFQHRVTEKPHLPDLIAAQELWPKPVCGVGNARGQAALTSLQECASEDYPGDSFLGILNSETGRDYALRYMRQSANAVIWAKDRFSYVDGTMWSFGGTQELRDACCGGATSESGCAQSRNIGMAVLLDDHRLTWATGDDRLIGVASIHTGGWSQACIQAHLDHAESRFERWSGENPDRGLSRRFISGDLNRRPDRSSGTLAEQKREEQPGCWWRGFVAGESCGGRSGEYFDTVWEKHWNGSTARSAPICGHWTFPMNSTHTRCDVVKDSAGQIYQRIDYTFLKGESLVGDDFRSHVDQGYWDQNGNGRFDWGEAYSDSHRGVYTEVDY